MISYQKGDLFQDIPTNTNVIIPHVVNEDGVWGAGFVLAISKKWKDPELEYRKASKKVLPDKIPLGLIQMVKVEDNVHVCNMWAQTLRDTIPGEIPLKYYFLRKCLKKLNKEALRLNAEIRAPKFGAGLAGGDWELISKMIEEEISVPVTVFVF